MENKEITLPTGNINEVNKTVRKDMYGVDPRNIVVQDGFNCRVDFELDELKESIRENGIKNAISVIPFKDENGKEKYRLVDGERRYRATMALIAEGVNIARIPAIYLSKSLTDEELLMEQLIRNEGKKFTEYEYGVAFRKFEEKFGRKPNEVCKMLGLAPWKVIFITHTERDPRVQALMRDGKIEGTEVRRIYQAHGKDDEEGAVKEILEASKKIGTLDKEGKEIKKVTLDVLDKMESKTLAMKDSAAIKKGLRLLKDYYSKFAASADADVEVEFDPFDILSRLEKGKGKISIIDILSDIYAEAMKDYDPEYETESVDSLFKEAE